MYLICIPTQEKLKEQGLQFEEALDKDPIAGRHEIMRQEQKKVVQGQLDMLKSSHASVKDWQRLEQQLLKEQLHRNSKGAGTLDEPPKASPEEIKKQIKDYYLQM